MLMLENNHCDSESDRKRITLPPEIDRIALRIRLYPPDSGIFLPTLPSDSLTPGRRAWL